MAFSAMGSVENRTRLASFCTSLTSLYPMKGRNMSVKVPPDSFHISLYQELIQTQWMARVGWLREVLQGLGEAYALSLALSSRLEAHPQKGSRRRRVAKDPTVYRYPWGDRQGPPAHRLGLAFDHLAHLR